MKWLWRCGLGGLLAAGWLQVTVAAEAPATVKAPAKVKAVAAASEDAEIAQFHAMGPVTGSGEVYRSANPVRDLAPDNNTVIDAPRVAQATARMQRLHDRGIRTVICFQHPDGAERVQVALEKQAAEKAGLVFVNHPLSNSGADSFETMSDEAARKVIEPIAGEIALRAGEGGVLFHCKAGHDRTGIVAGFLRIKYQGWPADRAIAEMRRNGHPWEKYARAGHPNSWLEEHLQAYAAAVGKPAT